LIKVLVADDHPVVRDALIRLLEAADGITVVATATTGQEALEAALEHSPDVVLMDIEMPSMNGIAAARALQESRSPAHVVMLTTFSDRERILAALDAGALGYLLKDAEPDEIVRGVRAAARGDSPLAAQAAREMIADRRRATGGAPGLSPREREVLTLVAQGLPNKLIARRLEISEKTVKSHLTRVFAEIGVTDRTQAALWAGRHGIG
jgi:DNA-binding NarL/FixJ family response regulator